MVKRRRESGYTLAVLAVFLTVLSVGLAVALPKWSTAIRREQEEELIFRGLQYAEAIRVFQKRFGRYPISLDELLETKPRCIRQLWKEPMAKDGKWRPIRQQEMAARAPGVNMPGVGGGLLEGEPRPLGSDEGEEPEGIDDGSLAGAAQQGAAGPMLGVRSRSKGASILTFLDQARYEHWRFTIELVQPFAPQRGIGPETVIPSPGGGLAGRIPNANWIGRPLPGAPATPSQLPASPGMPGGPPASKPEPQPEAEDGE